MILIAYDGSDDSRAAIEQAGVLTPGRPVTVLTVWEPFIQILARSIGGLGYGTVGDVEAVDRAAEHSACECAQEGAGLAREAGLDPVPLTAARHGATADAILAAADSIGAQAVVIGSRGRTGVKSVLLGSVSHDLVQRADLPVLVVPSPEVAERRAAHHVGAPATLPA